MNREMTFGFFTYEMTNNRKISDFIPKSLRMMSAEAKLFLTYETTNKCASFHFSNSIIILLLLFCFESKITHN